MPSNPVKFLKATSGFEEIAPSIVPGQRLFFDKDWNVVIEPCRFLSRTYESGCDTHDTHSSYGSTIQRFFLSCEKSDLHWKDVTFSELLAYQKILRGKYKARSINNYFAAIKGLYSWSVRHEVLSKSPFPTKGNRWERNPLKVPESEVAPRAIPAKHLGQIFDKMNETFRLAVKLALCSGMRAYEIAELKCSTLPAASSDYAPLSHFTIRRKGGKPAKIRSGPLIAQTRFSSALPCSTGHWGRCVPRPT